LIYIESGDILCMKAISFIGMYCFFLLKIIVLSSTNGRKPKFFYLFLS